jgi:hypothetical protein
MSATNTQTFRVRRPCQLYQHLFTTGILSPDVICKTYAQLGFLFGCPATMSGLTMVKDAPVSIVTWHGSCIQPSDCPLSTWPTHWAWNEGMRSMTHAWALVHLLMRPLPAIPFKGTGVPAPSACQSSIRQSSGGVDGVPPGTLVASLSPPGGPAAAFAASSYTVWFRALLSDLSPLRRCCCFTFWSPTPSMNAWATLS